MDGRALCSKSRTQLVCCEFFLIDYREDAAPLVARRQYLPSFEAAQAARHVDRQVPAE
jgi:hypothetical protein